MDNVFKNNVDIIAKRWPLIFEHLMKANLQSLQVEVEQSTLIVNGIQLTSNIDREAEAICQAELIPEDSTQAYIYGVALGDLPKVMLSRSNLTRLVVCIFNYDLLAHTLNAIDMIGWLNDERVLLVDTSMIMEPFSPFAVAPAELHFADDKSSVLRDKIVLELDNSFIESQHDDEKQWFVDAINNNKPFIECDGDIKHLTVENPREVFVIGAGPTLAEHFERLRTNQQSQSPKAVIAVDAAVRPLLNNGITPDIVVSIDYSSYLLFQGVDFTKLSGTALVYFPRISNDIVTSWQGARYVSYSFNPSYQKISREFPKTKLQALGSVIHPAVDLAVQKGASIVNLLGTDFGFPAKKTHVEGQSVVGTDFYSSSKHWVLNGKGEKINTMLNYRGYLRDLERYIETKPKVKFFNGSSAGAKIAGTTLLKDAC